MDESPRSLRLSSTVRGVFIAVLAAGYAYLLKQPGTSFAVSLLIAAILQGMVLLLRRFVPADQQPQAMHVFEMIADGISVLLFALGVFGGILHHPAID